MGIYTLFRNLWRLTKDRRYNHVLTESDREMATDINKGKAELRAIQNNIKKYEMKYELEEKKAELQDLKDELFPPPIEEETSSATQPTFEGILLDAFSPIIQQKAQEIAAKYLVKGEEEQSAEIIQPPKAHIPDEKLKEIFKSVPKSVRKKAKKTDEAKLKQELTLYLPNVDDDTLNRAAVMLRA